ncbi:Mitochondrial MRF1 N(5)-glutamine methyltransferase MTQ1 [Pseudozyma hubeiensis]|nr:Mitochondrial MRF1 N(5)-glutamine methyltransferase MTQ1 [Pseudozyma hubeiensis]
MSLTATRGSAVTAARLGLPSLPRQSTRQPVSHCRFSTSHSSSASSSQIKTFFTSDDLLLRSLRRRQQSYRLASTSLRKKADQLEAISLAKSEIRWAVQHVRSRQTQSGDGKQVLNRESRRRLISMVMQMTRENVPLSYLLGSVPFGNLKQELVVRPPVLLPRPETEDWATEVVGALTKLDRSQLEDIRIVDLCTGSGCIAILIADALRSLLPVGKWKVVACDRSPLAVELAIENARKLGFQVNDDDSKLSIVEADVFDDRYMDKLAKIAGGPFDLILSNPPYIPRREWEALDKEVKLREDPSALIGEREPGAGEEVDARQAYLNRHGLPFHQRLAELLYRPTFSTSRPPVPRLVAEYGKGQQKQVERLHAELEAPKDRLPRLVRVEGQMVVVGVGNATTHPLTRHSIGQVVLDPLLKGLIEQDRKVRARLKEIRDQLEATRWDALKSGRVVEMDRPDWCDSVPSTLRIPSSGESRVADLDLDRSQPALPSHLSKHKTGGWSSTLTFLIPSSPTFFTSRDASSQTIYSIDVSLYKPSQPMNLSGVGLRAFLSSFQRSNPTSSDASDQGAPPISDNILVLQDELDLPFGHVKRKDFGSARGHNGIRDIIDRLEIPTSSSPPPEFSASPSKHRKSGDSTAAGPKLSRLRIGIGRPENIPPAKKDSWLPASLQPKGMRVDKWVLSRLTQAELDSCTSGSGGDGVIDQVQSLALQWLVGRCASLTEMEPQQRGRVSSRKDQFGIFRTVWVT